MNLYLKKSVETLKNFQFKTSYI